MVTGYKRFFFPIEMLGELENKKNNITGRNAQEFVR
jgi:hypothetical protein